MCEYCDKISNEVMKNGEPEEGIFYNTKEKKYYLVVEQFRNERTRVKINYCPWCGRELETEEDTNKIICKRRKDKNTETIIHGVIHREIYNGYGELIGYEINYNNFLDLYTDSNKIMICMLSEWEITKGWAE